MKIDPKKTTLVGSKKERKAEKGALQTEAKAKGEEEADEAEKGAEREAQEAEDEGFVSLLHLPSRLSTLGYVKSR